MAGRGDRRVSPARGTAADSLLDALRSGRGYRGQIVHVERQEARGPVRAEPEEPLAAAVAKHLEEEGILLYSHQARALDAWRAGHDVLVATRTSSGKTLAFNLAAADALLADPSATALYLYPTKALAHDQVARLARFDAAVGLRARPAAYDGDARGADKARIRRESRIIVSNFYGLHEYLPQADLLQRFLSKLALVVVDEAHRYRGIHGSHVAFVLRRLARIAEALGAKPRYILASGTIANPGEHGAALINREVTVVDCDGSPQGERAVALWDSMRDPGRSAAQQVAGVAAGLASAGASTIVFTGSRTGAELVARRTAQLVPDHRVSPYRAGYLPSERRQIEAELREGRLDVVVSTNALELGIDFGGLDAAVLGGYPGTVASTWQQIGRAGRAGRPALAVLVAGGDPLDQYIVRRPHVLFGAPVEHAAVSLDNPEVCFAHVLCAAAEMPLCEEDAAHFGEGFASASGELERRRVVVRSPAGLAFAGTFRPASEVRIDGRSAASVEVRCAGRLVEQMEEPRALREAFAGAILLHGAQAYRVVELDLEKRVATAETTDALEHTEALAARDYELGEAQARRVVGGWSLEAGAAVVREHVTGYRLVRGSEVVGEQALDLPPVELRTRAVWLRPLDPGAAWAGPHDPLGALHAAEHALIHGMPLLAMCDRGDAGGLSTLLDRHSGGPMILLYDAFSGGTGIAGVVYADFERLAAICCDMAASCGCRSGCPRCVYDRSCGSRNQPMSREGAVRILAGLR